VQTWAEISERVVVAAGLLAGLDLAPGARIGIYSRNTARFDELKWGAFRAGLVGVPINWRLAPAEIAHILTDSAVEAIFIEADFLPVFDAPELALWRQRLICLSGDGPTALPHYDRLFDEAMGGDMVPVSPDDDALILYTGGTTGRSKGVRLSHTNILSCAAAFSLAYRGSADDTYLHVAPMFHSADLLATGWFMLGAAHAYLPVFSPQGFLDIIRDCGVTVTVSVPTMLMMTITDPAMAEADTSSHRRGFSP
jgi:long-chain acyl-CoA synthetase